MHSSPTFEINLDPKSVQRLIPPSKADRFEGVGFSPSGNVLGVATSETNTVLLFRRKADGLFEETPYQIIGALRGGLDYPHDISFSMCGDTELLAVAQRSGAISIYKKDLTSESYGPEPTFEIRGPETKLDYSDGVAFVPPNGGHLAACNLERGTISFFRRFSLSATGFQATPVFELKHRSIYHPDGLGFSGCGQWLAVANHGKQTVSIYRRRNRIAAGGKFRFGRRPVTVIKDSRILYPHSVAFSARTNHLVVTNAGANYFCVYAPKRGFFGMQWSQSPVAQVIVGAEETFKDVNTENKMEGGPKGVAIHENNLAVCSPQIGVSIYSIRESYG